MAEIVIGSNFVMRVMLESPAVLHQIKPMTQTCMNDAGTCRLVQKNASAIYTHCLRLDHDIKRLTGGAAEREV